MADGHSTEPKTPSAKDIKQFYVSLGSWPSAEQLPIVYHRNYNVAFCGFEKWNRLDAWKLDKTFHLLVEHGLVVEGEQPSPTAEASRELLETVHGAAYLEQLQTSKLAVIRLTELPSLFLLPNFLVQRQIMTPLKYQVSGTVLALGVALERGWSVHLGGGMIHASHDRGAGWSPYDDISCAIHYARTHLDTVRSAMVIDLGAHQGNGYQRNKLHFEDEDLFIVDIYNDVIFPQDLEARKAINVERRLSCGAASQVYLSAVESALKEASQIMPDLILYVAGTDVLEEDYSGQFHVSREDVFQRDQRVFEFARGKEVPICMVTSSGYAKTNSEVVAESVRRLVKDLKLV